MPGLVPSPASNRSFYSLRVPLREWRPTLQLRDVLFGRRTREKDFLTSLDMVEIVQPRVEPMDLLQELRIAASKVFDTDPK